MGMGRNNKNEIYQDLIDQTKSLDMHVFGPMKVGFASRDLSLRSSSFESKHFLWFDNVNVYDICRRMATNSQPGT